MQFFARAAALVTALVLALPSVSAANNVITSKTVTSSDGTQIYADSIGSPSSPHVVLLHGLQLSAEVFDSLLADSNMYHNLYIVRYDMRGHGRSGMPTTAAGHASNLYAADYAAVAQAFGLVKPVFVGWSLGATNAVDIASFLNPFPLSGIIYMDALPALSLAGVVGTPTILGFLPGLEDDSSTTDNKATEVAFGHSLWANPSNIPWSIQTSWVGMTTYQPPAVTTLALSRTQDTTALFALGKAGLPLLIIHGTADQQIDGNKVISSVSPYFPNITISWVQGGPHAVFYEYESTVSPLILNFVRKVKGSH